MPIDERERLRGGHLADTQVWRWPVAGCLVLSAVIHLGYSLCLQRGYQVADLSVVYPIARGTGPLLSSIGAFILLRETPSAQGILGLIAFASAIASLMAGAVAGAATAAVGGAFAFMCKFALAPREDKPLKGHRVLKTARIVASGLTAFIAPVLIAAIVLTLLKI